jgi:hypothetical protein
LAHAGVYRFGRALSNLLNPQVSFHRILVFGYLAGQLPVPKNLEAITPQQVRLFPTNRIIKKRVSHPFDYFGTPRL